MLIFYNALHYNTMESLFSCYLLDYSRISPAPDRKMCTKNRYLPGKFIAFQKPITVYNKTFCKKHKITRR